MSWELIQKSLEFIAEEMGAVLKRSSLSPNIRERLDFSCGIIDPEGRIIAQAEHIPVHLGSFKIMAKNLSDYFSELEEGDMLIVNDPYLAGTHLNDVTLLAPVMQNGKLFALVVNKAHQVDVGGPVPSSINPKAKTLYEEGLIIPPSKIIKKNKINEELLNIIKENFKTREIAVGDLKAQIAANLSGVKQVKELIERKGEENVKNSFEKSIEYTRKLVSLAFSSMPSEESEGEDYLEYDERFLKIKVRIRMKEKFYADFTGSSNQVDAPLNAVFGVTFSAVSFVARCLIGKEIPTNDGFYSLIEVHAPIGTIVNPTKPYPVSGGNLETSQRIVDSIFKALSKIMPFPAASSGTMMNIMLGGIHEGKYWSYYETIAGATGGRPNKPGVSAVHANMTNTMNTPIEIAEKEYPLLFTAYKIRYGSGGEGKFKGGDGVIRSFKVLDRCTISVLADRFKIRPFGVKGGKEGKEARVRIIRNNGLVEEMPSKFTTELNEMDEVIIETPGGGGYGYTTTK